jgi:Holliday junction resolvasome RuvABC endonuclease subunit
MLLKALDSLSEIARLQTQRQLPPRALLLGQPAQFQSENASQAATPASRASTSSTPARPLSLVVGIDPGLATSGVVVVGLDRQLLFAKSYSFPAVPKAKLRKLALTKGTDTERRLHRLWMAVEDDLSQVLRTNPGAQLRCVSIENLVGAHIDVKSALAAGVLRGIAYSFGGHVVTWTPIELRSRLGTKKLPSKAELFATVSRNYEVGRFDWTEHSQDALCVAEAGRQALLELEALVG